MYEDEENEYSDFDDSSDENMGTKKALAVELPCDFDPEIIPQTGEEYLRLVMYEARRCKQVVIATLDESKMKKPTYQVQMNDECVKAPNTMLPSLEWQEEKLLDFTKLCKFIQSKKKCEGIEDTIHSVHWIPFITDTQPNFSSITNLTEHAKTKLLAIIIDLLNKVKSGDTIADNIGLWLYSILAALDIPLCPNSCHCLRELARKCSIIRSKLPENCCESSYVHLNLIICLVSRYFKQFDLAD